MDNKSLTQFCKLKALELGFDKVGIAKAERVKSDSLLEEWLTSGFHGTMHWMENHLAKRVDPRELFPGAKTVLAVALNYYSPQAIADDPNTGKISRYAWGDDYHEIMKQKLRELLAAIQAADSTVQGQCCVDTSPIMDKYWAVQAGIGWQGKHTNVITRGLGSWVFLGEIVLNVALEYDTPIEDFCGTCRRCMDACPTAAITEPYVVDARKCISYLTIENREPAFPDGTQLDHWIYGCDVCQDVCPWNEKFSQPTPLAEFYPRSENIDQPLRALGTMTEEDFRRRFKNSPVKRTKFSGFIRNVRHVLSKMRG
jgi:epoxyqueuosine reductase